MTEKIEQVASESDGGLLAVASVAYVVASGNNLMGLGKLIKFRTMSLWSHGGRKSRKGVVVDTKWQQ